MASPGDRPADDLAALHRAAALATGGVEQRLAQWLEVALDRLDILGALVLIGDGSLVTVAAAAGEARGFEIGDELVDHRVHAAALRQATVAVLAGGPGEGVGDDADLGDAAVVASPLWRSGRVVGSLVLLAEPGVAALTAWDLALADAIADLVARTLEDDVAAVIEGTSVDREVPADPSGRLLIEQALADQVAFESLLVAISTRLITFEADDLGGAIHTGLAELGEYFGADAAFIDEIVADRSSLRRSYLWTREPPGAIRRQGERIDLAAFGDVFDGVDRAGHLYAGNGDPVGRVVSDEGCERDTAVLWVRLGSGPEQAGLVGLRWWSGEAPPNRALLGLTVFAADAFHGALCRQRAARLAEGQSAVFESIARDRPVSVALLGARQVLALHLPDAAVVVTTIGEDGSAGLVSADPEDPWTPWFAGCTSREGPYRDAVASGEPVIIDDIRRHDRYGPDAVPDPLIQALAVFPITSSRNGESLGAVVLFGLESALIRPAPEVLSSALSLMVVALERESDARLLAHQATHDPLTGAANRVVLLDRLGPVLARARRNGRPVAVLFCDLDGFKAVNDRHGHDRGDAVLVETARRITSAVRPSDTVARTGGDEFVVVSEGLDDVAQADSIAARIARAVESSPCRVDGVDLPMRLSIGVAVADPSVDDPDSLLRRADLAMYDVKARRRPTIDHTPDAP